MSKSRPNTDRAPLLCRVHVRVERWANRTAGQGRYLIPTVHLAAVNGALDEFVRFIESKSIPTVSKNERLVLKSACAGEMWLIDVNADLGGIDRTSAMKGKFAFAGMLGDRAFSGLVSSWRDLSDRWPEHVSEARNHFGDRFNEADYPSAEDLWKHFIAWGEYDGNELVSSHEILGLFSIFEESEALTPPLQDVFDGVSFGRELDELRHMRQVGEITDREFVDRTKELSAKYPVNHTKEKT